MVTYDNQPCFFLQQKKHQDTHAHNFTIQFIELTYRFKDVLPILSFITMKSTNMHHEINQFLKFSI